MELIGQLKPKNNGTFPIADVNDLKGGYIQLESTTELNAYLDTGKVKQGMLAYVAETNKIYQFQHFRSISGLKAVCFVNNSKDWFDQINNVFSRF